VFHPRGPSLVELAVQALSSTRRGYDLLAPRFDFTPFRTPPHLPEAVAPHLGEVERALDLCCGTGAAIEVLRPRCDEVVGVDFSEGMLAEARARFPPTEGLATVTLVQADVLELDYAEEFDLVTSFGAFGHFPPRVQDRLLQVVARALRPGGRFVFVTAHRPSRLTRSWWLARGFNAAMRVRNALIPPPFVMYYLVFLLPRARRLLRDAGFDVEVREHVLPAPFTGYAVVIARRA